MKTGFSILSLIFSSAMMAQSVHLTVPAVDASNNAVAIGMVYFTWGQFTDNNGVTVQAGQLTRPVTNGTIDVTLAASDNAGYVYTLLFMHGSTADTFKWRVPAAGATTMAQLNQPPVTSADPNVVRTDQANTYTAGKKQTFSSSATTAGEGFGGVGADPSTLGAGDRWFRTDIKHMRIYDGTTGQTVMYRSDTLPASQLANPTGATSLLFAANPFNVSFGSATGAGNMMTVADTAGNTGTGYVFTVNTGSGSAAKPFQVNSGAINVVDTDTLGGITLGGSDANHPVSARSSVLATLNIGAGNAFWFYNKNLLMQSNAAIGDSGNAYEFADNSGNTLRQLQISSLWIGATKNGTRVGGFLPSGSVTAAGLQTAVAKKTANYTATSDDLSLPCDATAGNVLITLPAAPKTGEWKALKKVDASINTCTYSGNGKTIDGATSIVYAGQFAHALAQYDGTQWWVY